MDVRVLACASLLAAACGASPVGSTGPVATAAPSNTSLATARPLAVGDHIDFVLPCGNEKVYFGPFAFSADGQRAELVTSSTSTTGEQVCGGGDWIDRDEVFVQKAGLGCAEGSASVSERILNEFTPGAGGSAATPQFLSLMRVGDPGAPGCNTLRVQLQVKALPPAAAGPS